MANMFLVSQQCRENFESFGSGTSDNDVDNQSAKSGQQMKD